MTTNLEIAKSVVSAMHDDLKDQKSFAKSIQEKVKIGVNLQKVVAILMRLEKHGIVEKEKIGKTNAYSLTKEYKTILDSLTNQTF